MGLTLGGNPPFGRNLKIHSTYYTGGGYQFRLCRKDETLTEECFMRTPLDFVGPQVSSVV